MLSLGILTLANWTYPLSIVPLPNFGPMSPTMIPVNILIINFLNNVTVLLKENEGKRRWCEKNLRKFHKHVVTRNSDFGKLYESVINGSEAKFWTNVSNSDTY